jgi:hypothetical protein
MSFWVYIIQSETTGRYYCGQSSDVERRLRQHTDPEYRLSSRTASAEKFPSLKTNLFPRLPSLCFDYNGTFMTHKEFLKVFVGLGRLFEFGDQQGWNISIGCQENLGHKTLI